MVERRGLFHRKDRLPELPLAGHSFFHYVYGMDVTPKLPFYKRKSFRDHIEALDELKNAVLTQEMSGSQRALLSTNFAMFAGSHVQHILTDILIGHLIAARQDLNNPAFSTTRSKDMIYRELASFVNPKDPNPSRDIGKIKNLGAVNIMQALLDKKMKIPQFEGQKDALPYPDGLIEIDTI